MMMMIIIIIIIIILPAATSRALPPKRDFPNTGAGGGRERARCIAGGDAKQGS